MQLYHRNNIAGLVYPSTIKWNTTNSTDEYLPLYFLKCNDVHYASTGIGFHAHANGMYYKLLGSDGSFYYMYCWNK